jgi:chromosome segregation ATPase
MKALIERLRNDCYQEDEVRAHAKEAADALERMGAEHLRLAGEVSNRNSRALAGDTATKQFDAMYEEIERLTAERDALKEGLDGWHSRCLDMEVERDVEKEHVRQCVANIAKLVAENAALRADAERYRWLRDGLSGPLAATEGMKRMAGAFGEFDDTPSAEQFDAAIDAAIGEKHD